MKFSEYFKIKNRMTKKNDGFCGISCTECPLAKENNARRLFCGDLERLYLEEAIEIVKKWAEEHPIKTRQDILFTVFPNARKHNEGFADIYPCHIDDNIKCKKEKTCLECKRDYWLSEIEEE